MGLSIEYVGIDLEEYTPVEIFEKQVCTSSIHPMRYIVVASFYAQGNNGAV